MTKLHPPTSVGVGEATEEEHLREASVRVVRRDFGRDFGGAAASDVCAGLRTRGLDAGYRQALRAARQGHALQVRRGGRDLGRK